MTAVVGIVLSLVTLGVLLNHLWEHRTEARRKRIRDSFPVREKLAAEYSRLTNKVAIAEPDTDLIQTGPFTETSTRRLRDMIAQLKAEMHDELVKKNEELRIDRDRLSKQVEVLSRPVTGQDQPVTMGDVQYCNNQNYGSVIRQDQEASVGDVRYHISMTTTANKKRKKKK